MRYRSFLIVWCAVSVCCLTFDCAWRDGQVAAQAPSPPAAGETLATTSNARWRKGFDNVRKVRVVNLRGRVVVRVHADADERSTLIEAVDYRASGAFDEKQIVVQQSENSLLISTVARVENGDNSKNNLSVSQLDVEVRLPARTEIEIVTNAGAVEVIGDLARVNIKTNTGTISVDVPVEDLRYSFQWTASRPRIYSAVELEDVQPQRGGGFEIAGRLGATAKKKKSSAKSRTANDNAAHVAASAGGVTTAEATGDDANDNDPPDASLTADPDAVDKKSLAHESKQVRRARERQARQQRQAQIVKLEVETARGVVLLGVDAATAPADLQPRRLTEAARAIIRTNDPELIERLRIVAPKLVDEYAGTLPPPTRQPRLTGAVRTASEAVDEHPATVTVAVTDANGRAINNLAADDFLITENNAARRITEVRAGDAPFNLILLLDVSGSVEERLDFIRRAALSFINTADARDRIGIISFRDDVQVVSGFTNDKNALRQRINDIEAGGGTALYDALAYTLVEVLKPESAAARERTAIVVLSDGDDNRSFLSFQEVNRLARETGAVFYPIYIPSGLIGNERLAARRTDALTLDPTRNRFLTLTTRAAQEGEQLARTTGGIFHAVTRFSEVQTAFDDTLAQLRNSYTLTYLTPLRTPRPRVQIKNGAGLVRAARGN